MAGWSATGANSSCPAVARFTHGRGNPDFTIQRESGFAECPAGEHHAAVVALAVLGLLSAALCGFAAITSLTRWCPHLIVAIAQLLVPWLAAITAIAAVVGVITGAWVVVACAVAALVPALVLMVPPVIDSRSPRVRSASSARRGIHGADTLTVTFANFFTDNDEKDAAAQQLLDTDADVIVIAELTDEIVASFDGMGGARRYPHRVHPTPIEGEYVVGIFSARPMSESSVDQVDTTERADGCGELRTVSATIQLDGTGSKLRMIAVHPEAPTDSRAFRRWRQQLRTLGGLLGTVDGPTVVLGDLNAGTLQGPFTELTDGPMRDAHAEAGEGLTPSWGTVPSLPRWVPTVVARLDHLLVSEQVEVLELEDLEHVGSDHRPFFARLALRHPTDETDAIVGAR